MDQDRQIRFAIPPFFLLASLLLGAYLGMQKLPTCLKPETSKEFLGLLAAGAVVVVPLGFLVSTISILIIKIIASVFERKQSTVGPYEARLSRPAFESVWRLVNSNKQPDPAKALYAVAAFDHELLAPGIHTWIMRRWNAFNVAAHSAVALGLAYFGAFYFNIFPVTSAWTCWTIALVGLLVLTAFFAWCDTMRMVEFQALRQKPVVRTSRPRISTLSRPATNFVSFKKLRGKGIYEKNSKTRANMS